MQRWKMSEVEPSLDDLLNDEIMIPVMRSAGVSAEQLRGELKQAAARVARTKIQTNPSGGRCCWIHT
jgi:hypothetical protein